MTLELTNCLHKKIILLKKHFLKGGKLLNWFKLFISLSQSGLKYLSPHVKRPVLISFYPIYSQQRRRVQNEDPGMERYYFAIWESPRARGFPPRERTVLCRYWRHGVSMQYMCPRRQVLHGRSCNADMQVSI